MFCWGTLCPAIHEDVTLTHATHLSIVPNHAHPGTVFSGGHGLFQQDNGAIHEAKTVQGRFEEQHLCGAEQAILKCKQHQWSGSLFPMGECMNSIFTTCSGAIREKN